jgi:hypothetical protein
MRKRGHKFIAYDPVAAGAIRVSGPPVLFNSPALMRQVGYGIFASRTQPDPNATYVASLSEPESKAFLDDLYGTKDKPGCLKETLPIATIIVTETASAALEKSNAAIRSDNRVMRMVRDWSKCMHKAGFDYSSPDEPPGRLAESVGHGTDLTAKDELNIARADSACTEPIFEEFESIRNAYDVEYFK